MEIKQIDKFQPLHISCINTLGEDRKNDTFLLPIYIIFLERKIQGVKKNQDLFIYLFLANKNNQDLKNIIRTTSLLTIVWAKTQASSYNEED